MGTGLAAFLLILVCASANAQPIGNPIEPGRRVRISILVPPGVDSTGFHSRDRLAGPLLHYDRSAITVEKRTIPWAAVSQLEYSAGRHGHAGSGALIGGLVGLMAGIAIGSIVAPSDEGDNSEYARGLITGGAGLGGLLFGAGIGAIVGGSHKTDDWLDIPLIETRSAPADSSR